MTATPLPTLNQTWGFFGTISQTGADAQQAWSAASAMIAAETNESPDGVRLFLDSKHGRYFADDVANALHAGRALEAAIESAIARWRSWRIGRQTSRDTGIPAGLPYLTGFVAHYRILDEADAADSVARERPEGALP